MTTNSIGGYTLTQWQGPPPQFPKQHVETQRKIGAVGVSAIALGVHGDPFEFTTTSYFASQADAIAAEGFYLALIGAAPVVVVYAGVNYYSSYSTKYLVESVMVESLQPLARMISPTQNLSPAWPVVARWRLVPIGV